MTSFFLSIVNVSITASVVAIAVILLRLIFKKAPRWISCALWALVGLRLVLPFAPESRFSLIPSTDVFTVQTSAESTEVLKVHTGIGAVNSAVNGQISTAANTQPALDVIDVLAVIWIFISAAVLLYGVISYLFMYLRVRTAIPLKGNVYQSENVKSPFVLGFIRPKIYIPFNLKGRTLKYVLAHEEAHIKRKDHIVKPFAFLLLSVHWFNPFLWLSYVLLCRDVEVACDEKVIKNYSINKRKNYAFALLDCKVNRSNIALCPVAFGEVNVSTRIKKTLCYKKPAVWIIAAAMVLSVLSACCLLTNPVTEKLPVKELEASQSVSETEPEAEHSTEAETTEADTEAASFTASPTESATEAKEEVTEEYYSGYEEETEAVSIPIANNLAEKYDLTLGDEPYAENVISEAEAMESADDPFNPEAVSAILADTYYPIPGYNTPEVHDATCTCSDCILSGKPIVWDYNAYYQQQNIYNNSPFNW